MPRRFIDGKTDIYSKLTLNTASISKGNRSNVNTVNLFVTKQLIQQLKEKHIIVDAVVSESHKPNTLMPWHDNKRIMCHDSYDLFQVTKHTDAGKKKNKGRQGNINIQEIVLHLKHDPEKAQELRNNK